MFNKNKRKGIMNEGRLDLRYCTPQMFDNVKQMNIGTVICPEHPAGELMAAYGNVRKKNIGSVIYLPEGRKIADFNGATVLSKENITPDAIHMINGFTVIKYFETDEPIEIIANGLTVYSQNTKLSFLSQNGLITGAPFEISDVKLFSSDAKIDSLFIENLSDGTVIAAGNNVVICNDVTLELLKSRQIYFAAGHNIKCGSGILGYIQTIATAGNKTEVNE